MSNQCTYYVYQITLPSCIYIGCTNNLQRRKDQHNRNAKTQTSKLGKYLYENNIVLTLNDFTILHECNDRKIAFVIERRITKDLESQGNIVMNDNYSKDCTRKGKNIGNTSKEYYLIDYINHTSFYIKDLRQYCINNNLSYKDIQRTVKGLRYCTSGYKAFYKNDWENELNKEKYLSGDFINESKQLAIESVVKRSIKNYIVKFPDGHTEKVLNLDKFAREHNLTSGTLHSTFTKNKATKGYQVIQRL